jgi:hypothetical protein
MDARISVLAGTRKSLLAEIPARLYEFLREIKNMAHEECDGSCAESISAYLSSIISHPSPLAPRPSFLRPTLFLHIPVRL